jgi:hypothetical protein
MQLMLMWSGGPLGQESGKNCLLWLLRLGHAQHAASFRHLWCADFLQGRLNADDEQKEKKTNLCFPFFCHVLRFRDEHKLSRQFSGRNQNTTTFTPPPGVKKGEQVLPNSVFSDGS